MSKKIKKGFTLIEAMVALFVVGVALVGLATIAGGSVQGNIISHDYAVAATLAQRYLDEIEREALHWNNSGIVDFTEPDAQRLMPLLLQASTGDMPTFMEATSVLYGRPQAYTMTLRRVSPMFSGAPDSGPAKFCVHYRLTWVVQSEIMRAEIRVLWYKPTIARTNIYANCGAGGMEETMAQDRENINLISMAKLIKRYIITR